MSLSPEPPIAERKTRLQSNAKKSEIRLHEGPIPEFREHGTRANWERVAVALLWMGAVGSVVGMLLWLPERLWDIRVVSEAMQYLRQGLDPYQASVAHQKAELALGHRVFIYWYPPISLTFLTIFGSIPQLLRTSLFWIVYASGILLQLRAGSKLVQPGEWKVMQFLLPLAVFFPGFVPSDSSISGNIAFPIWGAVMIAAVHGWETKRWGSFYAVVVVGAAVTKPPILVWLALPLLISFTELPRAAFSGIAGLVLFGIQRLIFPEWFSSFLQTVRYALPLESNYSATGVAVHIFSAAGIRSALLPFLIYPIYAIALFGVLLYLSQRRRADTKAASLYFCVALVGTVLLGPRIKEYDLLPITIPMCLIVLRGIRDRVNQVVLIGALLVGIGAGIAGWDDITSLVMLVSVFTIGVRQILQQARLAKAAEESTALESVGSAI